MGHAIERIAKQRGHEIVCIIDEKNLSDIDSLEFASADVAIEFTTPETAYGNYLRAFSKGVRVVSGTTGWTRRLPTSSVCATRVVARCSIHRISAWV